MSGTVRPWPRLSSETLVHTPIFDLRRDRVRSPRLGTEHDVLVLETGDWINVIPVTDAGDVVMIRQWRHGTRSVTLEIPGGLVDPGDPDPMGAAVRELREETGYEARCWTLLGSVDPNPAFLTNTCHTFLAEGAHPVGEQALDGGEDIAVELVPLSRVPALIEANEIRHALVVAAFCHLWRRQKAPGGG